MTYAYIWGIAGSRRHAFAWPSEIQRRTIKPKSLCGKVYGTWPMENGGAQTCNTCERVTSSEKERARTVANIINPAPVTKLVTSGWTRHR